MARPARQTRTRTRPRAGRAPTRPLTAAVTPDADAALPASPRAVRPRPQQTAVVNRGFATDHSYIIGELRRIFILTSGIILLLLVLWLILGQ